MKRSLLLAGGGLRVAFQAGVLQVWLDEAGITFDHVDACSGGAFNLAMHCQGRSGTEIADAWRRTRPLDGVSARWSDLVRFPYAPSLVTLDGYRDRTFPAWGLDFERIRASDVDATFNVFDVTHQRLRALTPAEMTADALCACVGLATWFPTVELDGDVCTDAAYVTDADVEGALERGADEIWIVWTMSTTGEWRPGLLAQNFHTLEAAANGTLRRALDRIEHNNAERAAGRPGAYGRHVTVRILEAEVPLHYMVVVGADRLHRAVERGVAAARAWCDREGFPHAPATPAADYEDGVALRFVDGMHGVLTVTPQPGDDAVPLADVSIDVRLELVVDDTGDFVSRPDHHARVEGVVGSPLFGGDLPVVAGSAAILVDDGEDPTRKQMRYRLHLGTGDAAVTLVGVKTVDSARLRRLWAETTTLHTHVLRGHVPEGASGRVLAAGVLRMGPLDVARQVVTVTVEGAPDLRSRARALRRFGAMFVGHLWDVYARPVLAYAPF